MNSGIYKIVNLVTNECYIGSACKLNRREYEHFNLLTKNKHYNKYLQRAYNKYKDFKFEVLAHCPKEYLIKMEQWFLDNLKPVYNAQPTAGSNLGFKFSDKSKKIKSEQAKAQIKNAKLNRNKNSKLKLTIDDVIEIKKLIAYNISNREICKKYNVAETTISAIRTNTTWSEVPNYIVPLEEQHLIKTNAERYTTDNVPKEVREKIKSSRRFLTDKGQCNKNYKLNAEKVYNIKLLLKDNISCVKIAELYDV
ncbi:MAG: GIY-YIG nuclease family protein, partial [Romboutsia sp.]|nr:GIY-YIG nuclease family protein [Romboutsia sp.]